MRAPRTTIAESLDDRDLLVAVARGQLEALGTLFDRHEVELRRYFRRLGATEIDTDDLIQSTFIEINRTAAHYNSCLPARAWIFGIATMMIRRQRRSFARALTSLTHLTHTQTQRSSETPGESFESSEDLRRFEDAFSKLSSRKREVFALIVLEELPGQEVAAILGIPVNTVWTRLHHARAELRKAFDSEGP